MSNTVIALYDLDDQISVSIFAKCELLNVLDGGIVVHPATPASYACENTVTR